MVEWFTSAEVIMWMRTLSILGIVPMIMLTLPAIARLLFGRHQLVDPFLAVSGIIFLSCVAFQIEQMSGGLISKTHADASITAVINLLLAVAGVSAWFSVDLFHQQLRKLRQVQEESEAIDAVLSYLERHPEEARVLIGVIKARSSSEGENG